jgi:hypothetical protein
MHDIFTPVSVPSPQPRTPARSLGQDREMTELLISLSDLWSESFQWIRVAAVPGCLRSVSLIITS